MRTFFLFIWFFWSSPNFGHKNRFNSGEFPEKVRTRQNYCAHRPQKNRGNIGFYSFILRAGNSGTYRAEHFQGSALYKRHRIVVCAHCIMLSIKYRPVGRAVTRSSLEREVWGSNLGPVKSDTVLPTARHRCDISSNGAVLPGRNDAEMGPTNSLHASAYYSEFNERFDLITMNPNVNSGF